MHRRIQLLLDPFVDASPAFEQSAMDRETRNRMVEEREARKRKANELYRAHVAQTASAAAPLSFQDYQRAQTSLSAKVNQMLARAPIATQAPRAVAQYRAPNPPAPKQTTVVAVRRAAPAPVPIRAAPIRAPKRVKMSAERERDLFRHWHAFDSVGTILMQLQSALQVSPMFMDPDEIEMAIKRCEEIVFARSALVVVPLMNASFAQMTFIEWARANDITTDQFGDRYMLELVPFADRGSFWIKIRCSVALRHDQRALLAVNANEHLSADGVRVRFGNNVLRMIFEVRRGAEPQIEATIKCESPSHWRTLLYVMCIHPATNTDVEIIEVIRKR
jgi:hypothetical protein